MRQECECSNFLKVAIGLPVVAVLVYLCWCWPWLILGVVAAVAGWLVWGWTPSHRCYLRGTSLLGLFNTVIGCLFNRVLVVAKDTDTGEVVGRYWDRADAHPPGEEPEERCKVTFRVVSPSEERGKVILQDLFDSWNSTGLLFEAYVAYAERLGKTVEQLTEEEKGEAFRITVLEKWNTVCCDVFQDGGLKDVALLLGALNKELKVPGFAYLDGRDPDAKPPLTVMRINLWDSIKRSRVVGRLKHGQRVLVLERVWNLFEERHYYLVRRWRARGWVPETFLSAERAEAIGDRYGDG